MTSPRARRPELEQAFQHIAEVGGSIDLTGITDPAQQWLTVTRGFVPHYGQVGQPTSLEGVEFTPVLADGVPAEWVTTANSDPTRRIVWIHGGAWAAGAPIDYREMSATLARFSGAAILMVDYRLAPEHRFPAGLDDCVKAFEWAAENGPTRDQAGSTNRDPATRISLMGDSAGGNLAAATCIRLVTAGVRKPDRLVLIAGTLDNVSIPERIGLYDLICTPESFTLPLGLYLKPGDSPADPLVSPVFAPASVLEQFPPTLIQVSTSEALLFDSRKFAALLEKASVRVDLSLWPELPHVWHAFLDLFPEAREALAEISDFLRR